MEESFRVRVDKAFSSISSSAVSSLWSLTVDEIKPKKLKLDSDDPFSKDLQDFDDEIEDQEEVQEPKEVEKPEDYNDEEWEIKSGIGLDCTLDNEEEEDAYDKVAAGMDKVRDEDRLYMKDVNDYDVDTDLRDELPFSFKDRIKDPRANHMAAKVKLKEDADAANKINSLQVSDDNTGDDDSLKSILKRKDNKSEPKENQSTKRVRFDPECKPPADEENSMDGDVISDRTE